MPDAMNQSQCEYCGQEERYGHNAICVMNTVEEQRAEIERLRAFVGWIDSWVSNPVGSYSVSALDGLFGLTRDKIEALGHQQSTVEDK